jgi:ADP-ribose pyrophosphatase
MDPKERADGIKSVNVKSRTGQPKGYPVRTVVDDEHSDWDVPFEGYDAPYHVDGFVLAHDYTKNPAFVTGVGPFHTKDWWADPEDISQVDFRNRTSFTGPMKFNDSGRPLNPMGRTGISGRGLLGKWGTNYAADPIITRINPETNVLEMVAIKRKDTGEWAIPGGMVDSGEVAISAGTREALEEAVDDTSYKFTMDGAEVIYQGYVDDPRNTDNSWMETSALHKHLADEEAEKIVLRVADNSDPNEIAGVKWMPLTKENLGKLYASHGVMVKEAMKRMEESSKIVIDEITATVRNRLEV